jgi:hypothetical protein
MKIKYLATMLITIAGLSLTQRAHGIDTYLGEGTAGYAAHYTNPTDAHLMGTVIPTLNGIPGGQVAEDVYMVNYLRAHPGHTVDPTFGGDYFSTGLAGPAAVATNALTSAGLGYNFVSGQSGPVTIDLNAVGTFTYLVVAYDGPNSGAAVWNIAGLTGTISFDRYGSVEVNGTTLTGNLFGSNTPTQYLITSFTLLNPTSAPDGGTTVMLLGAALGALGMVRRYLSR